MTSVSALLPIYHGADARHFRLALESLRDQLRPADEVVIVCDGPLGSDLETVLEEWSDAVIVRSERHRGVGRALQLGVESATGEWIARCDADDISEPDRLERQLRRVAIGDVDVVGAAMLEFMDEGTLVGVRRMPESHEAILKSMRWNNAINHPTVLMRRDAVLAAGNYRDVPYLEDYDLWVRMIARGATTFNVPEPLVRFRSDDHLSRRRLSSAMLGSEWTVHRELKAANIGLRPPISWGRLPLRIGFRLLPPRLMRGPYRQLFLTRGPEGEDTQARN